MAKILVTSDNHFDLNELDEEKETNNISEYLKNNKIDNYIIAGDLTNNFNDSIRIAEKIQQKAPDTNVRFISGNHDMFHGVTYKELELNNNSIYQHNSFFDVKNYRIILNNGWYDYSFVNGEYDIKDLERFKRNLWADKIIEQNNVSDETRFNHNFSQMLEAIKEAKRLGKKTILIDHFVLDSDEIKRHRTNIRYDKVNAFLGSNKMEIVLGLQDFNVEQVLYGHHHAKFSEVKNETEYTNVSVGYKNEWTESDFFNQWKKTIKIIEI